MLTKLLKYEYKATARTMIPFYVALIIVAIVNRVSMFFQPDPEFFHISQMLLAVIYGLFIAAVFVMTMLVMIQRFYKNLMGQEGYLMFTIPVTPTQNLLAKAIVSFTWFIASVACTFISVFILIPDYSDFPFIWSNFDRISREFLQTTGMSLGGMLWIMVAFLVVSMIQFIFEIYTAICIGHQANDHKILASFGAYVGIYVVIQTFNAAIISIINLFDFNWIRASIESTADITHNILMVFGFVFAESVALIIGYFFINRHLLGKKLNLE